MMLAVVALATWSAASVASAMPVHVVRSAHESATWNETNTTISGSIAGISSSYFDSSEERVEPPAEFKSVLESLHAPMLQGLSEVKRNAMNYKLTRRIEVMNQEFTRLSLAKENGEISEGSFVLDWINYVKPKYTGIPEIAYKVIFETLATHFRGDDLCRVLVAGANIDTKQVALELLDLQFNKWVELKSDSAKVFELLQLGQTNGNPITRKFFRTWVSFVESSYHNSPENAYENMLSVLSTHFGGTILLWSRL